MDVVRSSLSAAHPHPARFRWVGEWDLAETKFMKTPSILLLPCLVASIHFCSILTLLAKESAEPIDLTKTTPSNTGNSYNLGPTGALGWM